MRVWLALALLAAASPAQAFDCGKAATASEKAKGTQRSDRRSDGTIARLELCARQGDRDL